MTQNAHRQKFEQYIRKNHKMLVNIAGQRPLQLADGEQIVQESYVQAWKKFELGRCPSPGPLILMIIKRMRIDWMRRLVVRKKYETAKMTKLKGMVALLPSEEGESDDFRSFAIKTVRELPDKLRSVIEWWFKQEGEKRIEALAEHLGVSNSTVSKRLDEGLRLVHRQLQMGVWKNTDPSELRALFDKSLADVRRAWRQLQGTDERAGLWPLDTRPELLKAIGNQQQLLGLVAAGHSPRKRKDHKKADHDELLKIQTADQNTLNAQLEKRLASLHKAAQAARTTEQLCNDLRRLHELLYALNDQVGLAQDYSDKKHFNWARLIAFDLGRLPEAEHQKAVAHLAEKGDQCRLCARRLEQTRSGPVLFPTELALPNPGALAAESDVLDERAVTADGRLEARLTQDSGNITINFRSKDPALNHRLIGFGCKNPANGLPRPLGFAILRPDVNGWFAAAETREASVWFEMVQGTFQDLTVSRLEADQLHRSDRDALVASVRLCRGHPEAQSAWQSWLADSLARASRLPRASGDVLRQLQADMSRKEKEARASNG